MGAHRVRLAGPLKDMLYALGLSVEQVDGSLREDPCDLLCGKTPRWFMQYIATEFIRHNVSQDFWVNLWRVNVDRLPPAANVVTDDVRFPNEVKAIKAYTGKSVIIEIVRPGLALANPRVKAHVSEAGGVGADHVLMNDGSLDDLYFKLGKILMLAGRNGRVG